MLQIQVRALLGATPERRVRHLAKIYLAESRSDAAECKDPCEAWVSPGGRICHLNAITDIRVLGRKW